MIEYAVDLSDRHAHLYRVEARFQRPAGEVLLRLPVWTPGSYLVREFQRHLQDLRCSDEDGRPLAVRKVDKSTWSVQPGAARTIIASYQVYAALRFKNERARLRTPSPPT